MTYTLPVASPHAMRNVVQSQPELREAHNIKKQVAQLMRKFLPCVSTNIQHKHNVS
jgi:hypothetical protein